MTRSGALLLAAVLLPAMALADGASGAFSGLKGHHATGGVELARTASGWEVRLAEDFGFDGAPDARIGFGSGGVFVDATDFAPLRANSGAQVYAVPDGIDPEQYDEIYIWCRQYSVPLGVATIE